MWASRHPPAWPTRESRCSAGPSSRRDPSLFAWTNSTRCCIRVALACWFCTTGHCHGREQFGPIVQSTLCSVSVKLHEEGDVSGAAITTPSYHSNCLSCSKITQNVLDVCIECVQAARQPSFRVRLTYRALTACVLNIEAASKLAFPGSVLIETFLMFELCQHSFYFLSRFLVKYFKYFKGCGVRI